ncbi:hypothetical protein [Comamonas terrigena]|uniref:hypothetical protein n=1 Tax=Comamonas terrigena TaxID=32013 RepID=UPI002354BD0D|nr:hypothetical protein [Comamonas terrigena]
MGILELLAAMGITALTSVKLAGHLADKLISIRIARNAADHAANLNLAVNAAKAEIEARLKQEVELRLGDAAADRLYHSEARRRLYQAVGPLRYQLLVAAAEWTNRVARIGDIDASMYDMSFNGHFLRSTAYRFLRLLTVAELIERQIAFADFAVDPDMRTLLKFKRQLGQCFSSSDVSLKHPQEDWLHQLQHVFSDTLSGLAAQMVVTDSATGIERVARFDEFQVILDDKNRAERLHPIPALMIDFTPTSKPILWLRVLALSQLCTGLLEMHGRDLGIEVQAIDVKQMLALAKDKSISDRTTMYLEAIESFRSTLQFPESHPKSASFALNRQPDGYSALSQ